MESTPNELKKYDTPEARQAYQSYKAQQPAVVELDHGNLPQNLWKYDTQQARQEFQNFQLGRQNQRGLQTSDGRTYSFTDAQLAFVSQRYKASWQYQHSGEDLLAQQQGQLPPSLYSKYSDKSAYDQWALQMGMPNEKDLEKYLTEYDEYIADVNKYATAYNAKVEEHNAKVAQRQADDELLSAFYGDVGDRLYRAEFNGVKRGSDEWYKIFNDTLNETQYAPLKRFYKDPGAAISGAVSGAVGAANESAQTVLDDEEKEEKKLTADEKKAVKAFDKDRPEYDAATEASARERWGDLFPTFDELPEVPELSFSAQNFADSYNATVTGSESARGTGLINDTIRAAAGMIGYTEGDQSSTGGSGAVYSTTGSVKGGRGGSFGEGGTSRGRVKQANETDTAAVCKDLVVQGFNTEDYWLVIGGLTAGTPASQNPYGPGFVLDEGTQRKVAAYGNVISTRYGTDVMKLVVNGATEEELQAFVAKAVEQGATREILENAYNTVMTALGGSDDADASRDWDGLSSKARKKQDESFKKLFDAAISTAPSIPVGSGWTGKYQTKEERDAILAQRGEFDLEKEFATDKYSRFDKEAAESYWSSLTPEERMTDMRVGPDDFTVMGAVEKMSEGHSPAKYNAYELAGRYATLQRFREDAKKHGYSDWEVDQFFRRKGYTDQAPWETTEEYDVRKAQNYRQYLIESANVALLGEEPVSVLDAEHKQAGRGGVGGKLYVDPVVEYFNSISDADLAAMMNLDASTDNWEQAWTIAPAMMITRGAYTYAASMINFADMVAHQGAGTDSWEVAKDVNATTQRLAAFYRKDNQSKFVATLTDAGSEMVRMFLTAKTGAMFGEAVGGVLGAGIPETAAWLEGGSKAAKFVGWTIESVPFVTGAMGSSYAEARAGGATNGQAATYGVLAGLVEGLTEKVSAELIIGDGGSRVLNKVVGKLMGSGAAKLLKGIPGVIMVNGMKMLLNAGIEAQEEGLSYLIDLPLQKWIYDPDAKFSWSELGAQMGMGALCGALGLAFQNYGRSYTQSMMEFAMSSQENLQKFANFAMNQYGVSLGTDGNYVVTPEDYDPNAILSDADFKAAWTTYLDACSQLKSAQRQYDSAIESLNADDTEKAQQVAYWRNQVAAFDANDPASAKAMVNAMEQLTVAERTQADTAKKNAKLRADARAELNRVRQNTINTKAEASAAIRAHSRSAIAATLGIAAGEAEALDSSYQMSAYDLAVAQEQNAQEYTEAVDRTLRAVDQLETAETAQRDAQAQLAQAATNAFLSNYSGNSVVVGALTKVNGMAVAQDLQAANLDAAADAMSEQIIAQKRLDDVRTAAYNAELEQYDSWFEAESDSLNERQQYAYDAYKAGDMSSEQYAAELSEIFETRRKNAETLEAQRAAAAESYAAEGGQSVALQGLIDSMRLDAETARAKAESIRNAVVRALALRTQETALAAIDEVVTGEGVLTAEQREALSDELNQIVADGLVGDEATQIVLDAIDSVTQQMQQKTSETAPEAQESTQEQTEGKPKQTSAEREEQLQKAQAIGNMLGVDVRIVDGLPSQVAGRYGDKVIYISKDADNAPMRVLIHELTHYLENTTAYNRLVNYVIGVMGADPNFNLETDLAFYRSEYAAAREQMGQPQLSDEEATNEAKAEMVAYWCQNNLFTNQQSINNLVASQQSLGKRILNGIQNMLSGNRKNPATAELRAAEKLYIKALNAAKAFGGSNVERNSVVATMVASGMYVDTTGDSTKFYRVRYDSKGNRTEYTELKPNFEDPINGPVNTDDILNHSPIGAFIKLGHEFGTLRNENGTVGFSEAEEECMRDGASVNFRGIPAGKLSTAGKIINLFTDVANMCTAYGDNQMVWDFIGGYVYSSITANSDPQYSRTTEYGSVCRKTQNLITAMSEAMRTAGRGLTSREIVDLSARLVKEGKIDQPCSMCYVFNRWLGLGGYLNRIKAYQDRYAGMTPAEAMSAFETVQDSLNTILAEGSYESLVKELAAKCGLDADKYLEKMAKPVSKGKKISMPDARANSIQIYAAFLDDCLQNLDKRHIKDPDSDPLYQQILQRMDLTDAYSWFTKVLLNKSKSGGFSFKRSVLSKDGQSWATRADGNASFVVPTDILFDLNASNRFAAEYPDVWKFRTSGGPQLGKATYGYTDARLGEFTYGASVANVISQKVPKASRYGLGAERFSANDLPKNRLSFVNWNGEFAAGGKATFKKALDNVRNQSLIGGDRMQSSTDYLSKNALDYLITAFEMQCLGATVQTYSKVTEGLAFFDMIGAHANASLISPGKGYTGTPELVFDERTGRYGVKPGSAEILLSKTQGVDPEVAKNLSARSDTVQPICVAMNREHLAVIGSTPWITMSIPVHLSGSSIDNVSERAVAQGDPALLHEDVVDATPCQTDYVLDAEELEDRYKNDPDRAKKLEDIETARTIRYKILDGTLDKDPDLYPKLQNFPMLKEMYEYYKQYGANLKPDKKNPLGFAIYPYEYWDRTSTIETADINGDRFEAYCEMLGVLPRFSYGPYGPQGEKGQPGYWPGANRIIGYWNTLTDHKMYNADGTYHEAGPVDISGLTAQMLAGQAPTRAEYNGTDDLYMYKATENADMASAQETALRVGRDYGANLQGNAADMARARYYDRQSTSGERYALAGDVEARLAEFRKKYGSMTTTNAPTAPGRENVVLPTQTTDDTYVRRAAQTFMRSPNVTDAAASEIGRDVIKGDFNYERVTNEETASRATQAIIDLGGQVNALKYLENVASGKAQANATTVALGEQLILDAQAAGDANAFERAVVYTALIGTTAGQTVQAFTMINKLSPQGVALYIQKVLDHLNNVEYKKQIANGKMKKLELTEEQTQKLLSVKSFGDATRVQTEILEEIAAQIPLTVQDQLRNWRYMCMLGNVRTNVRNVCGNLAMGSMRMGRDVIAAGLEAWDVRRGVKLDAKAQKAREAGDTAKAERLQKRADRKLNAYDRTKTIAAGDAFRANKEYARATLAEASTILEGGGKDVSLSALGKGKRMFNNKVLNKIGKTALKPLEVFDVKFLNPLYVNSFAQWMTARGLSADTITLQQRNEAMKYAVQEAQEATFREANWLATKLTEIRGRNIATELIVGGVVPFAKTPANVLRRGIEYSPAGILQGFSQLHKANTDASLSQSERMQMRATAISRLASGLEGSALMGLGVALRALGFLRGAGDDDDRANKFMKDMGYQPYSAEIGDASFTLDWLAPLNMPMFMGVAIWDVAEKLSEGEDLDWHDVAEPLFSIADPMIEMSMLQGVQSALKTYGNDGNTLSAVTTNVLQSFAGQFYPTIGGQTARTIDLTRRSPDSKQYWIQSMLAKIPGLSKFVKPYVGGYGEEEVYEDPFGWDSTKVDDYVFRAIEQYVLPGYVKVKNRDALTEELTRLYESTGVSTFLPQRPSDYKTINLGKTYGVGDVQKVDLTYEQQVEYDKLSRQYGTEAIEAVISDPGYKGLTDADKADLLTEAYNAGVKKAREEYKKKIRQQVLDSLQQQGNGKS